MLVKITTTAGQCVAVNTDKIINVYSNGDSSCTINVDPWGVYELSIGIDEAIELLSQKLECCELVEIEDSRPINFNGVAGLPIIVE